MKKICLGQTSLATTVRGTVTVNIPGTPMRLWSLGLVGHVAPGTAATDYDLQVRMITLGGEAFVFNSGAIDAPWAGFINREGHRWDLTDDFGDTLADVPQASGNAGVVIEVINQNAGTVLVSAIACMMA